ncbi:MAG: hypothetical protein EAZ53_11870 [Bacteroidetes bacterium]|nr:MAG: hypothetical protein EAZ53_11870 [Bacteroidota bacterium]
MQFMKYLFLIVFLISSCKQKKSIYQVSIKNVPINVVDIFSDIKIIFVSPDSIKLDSLSKQMSEEKLYQNIQTNNYYSEKFKMYLAQKKLDYGVSSKQYVGFVSKNSDTLVFDTKKVELNWFLLVFDGYNFPTYISNISIPEE